MSYIPESIEPEELNNQNRTESTQGSNSLPISETSVKQRSSTPLERKESGTASQESAQSLSAVRSRSVSREGEKENRDDPPPPYRLRESDVSEIFYAGAVYVPQDEKCDRPPSGHNQEFNESPRRGITRQSIGACANAESDNIMMELLRQMQRTQQLQQEQINEQNRLQRESQVQQFEQINEQNRIQRDAQLEQQRMFLDALREERRAPSPVTGMDQAVAAAMQRQADALEQQNIALKKQNYLSEQQLGRRENQGNGHSLRTLKDLPEFDGRNGPSVVKLMKQFERCKESENWGNRDAIKWL
ncbi:MAG: hypothetical protein GY696_34435, partial [Gammaproteobacteria bacterium]|nr:hypothetical protein [Gammaproteobacteria bacterium]